ncbi:hypothetical protein RO3G_08166 [Rhizopus delemar RA 99-880]|uniref:GPI ethanolamine phosphate transferase 2 n=1 Tax=Rhizopus delemar (strain RA 99-880 / ATCC MYA-4621 / FGSC 9543 / NRRL 43880) TaxID=246409 RepID=I1C4T1_RHIO9|nr:hypothetical protein RO3G_08166 [Rhizopus delemar RA 99-880]|eukprot:EIE83461.1 hypothetical protein RO3G_08166 [Rhizopus delemar RA 99-880]
MNRRMPLGEQSGFSFVKSQIEDGTAIPFTAKATAPTVTMPRIKALTTGTIPSFLDAILNIAESDTSSSLDFYDNWVYQLKMLGNKTVHFYGDDTWIRLFPELFDKADGTTSFYVSDTIQVDLNVTRHIQSDISNNDWDITILHYLGLDHVGHLGGPESPLMLPKQKEMDEAIESIYEIISTQDAESLANDPKAKGTLIVICGDHGMNEKGNHGGSSIGETSTALVFLSPRFKSRPVLEKFKHVIPEQRPTVMSYPVVNQIDIVPTLASLLSFPIPKNNLGKVIIDLLKTEDEATVLRALYLNAFQLGQLIGKMSPAINKYVIDPLSYVDDDSDACGKMYARAVMLHKQYLSTKTYEYADESLKAYNKVCRERKSSAVLRLATGWNSQEVSAMMPHWHLVALSLGTTAAVAINNVAKLGKRQAVDVYGTATYKIRSVCSVVEGNVDVKNTVPKIYNTLLSMELIKTLNQVQLGKLIYNYSGASLFVLYALHYVIKRSKLMSFEEERPSDNENSKLLQALLYSVTPLLILLSGTHNAALFLVFLLQYHLLKSWKSYLQDKSPLPSWLLGVIMLCYCHASFFMTGHSNSIASVDLSNAYVGVEGYNVIVIGVLTFISNWSASLWWAVAGWSLVTDSHEPIVEMSNKWFSFIITQSSFFSIALSSLSISVTVLREHLFIWTVFSPKYLYQVAWNCLFHCISQVFLGTFIILFSCNSSTNQERDEIEMINPNTEE